MTSAHGDGQAAAAGDQYRALLGVSEAIVSHRDLSALFHELADRLHQVVRFDYLALLLHEAASNGLRLHVLEPPEPSVLSAAVINPVEDSPVGLVWRTQQPLIIPNVAAEPRWPEFVKRSRLHGCQSACQLPLTTARRRLGALAFACKEPFAYDAADVGFLQLVANQAAVAVENALAFQEIDAACRQITALKEQLAKEKAYLEEEARTEHHFGEIVGDSAALLRVLKHIETVAPTDSTVLIRGETGTGKELIARALHELSPRRERTFVKLNCAAIPTGLLESELFGHEKGAFTGAVAQKVGRFELAHQGTLFLDEAGDIPLELQPKLLRVLQEQEFERLGGTRTIKVDVRLVAATHRDLAKMVADGRFREDLYYRLNVFPVVLPPLRERRDDVPRLVRHFTQRFARRMGRRIETIPTAVMDALVRYPWPGNVRELQNVIERAVILSPGPSLQVPLGDLQPPSPYPLPHDGAEGRVRGQTPAPAAAPATLADAEREHILGALRETGWVLGGPKGAAARLGMKRSLLYWKMKKLGISRPE
ncbi:MAG TPA: sigma 54-interacting transcriptional regulator [Gemmataceae bacterium]|nr:sigma 54-interacting transcriptional regulator [Gemmataceae bacterium]